MNWFITRVYDIIEDDVSQELVFDLPIYGLSIVNDNGEDLVIKVFLDNSNEIKEISFTIKPDESFEEVFYSPFKKMQIESLGSYRMILRV